MPKANPRKARMPVFPTDEAERVFWDTHDVGDYLAATRPAEVKVSRLFRQRTRERKANLTMRMEPSRVREIKALAESRGVPYQTLMRMWIFERLSREKAG